MKRQIFLILFTVLFLALLIPGIKITKTSAQTEDSAVLISDINQRIWNMRKEIQQFWTTISMFRLQKEIKAESYLAINLSNDSVLFEGNSNKPYPIASLVKLMTAVIASENINLNQTTTLSEEMLEPLGYSPALFTGLNITAENLLKAALIQSVNDAALSLTYFMEKGRFLDLMNQKAKELNMKDTLFYDPHGLNPSNTSTASDIAELLTYIYKKHPEILNITRDNDFWLQGKEGKPLKFKNVNDFYQFVEFLGGKTGYLEEAKNTAALIFNSNGRPVAVILLYSPNYQIDGQRILNWLKNNSF